jgi:hypothetical protein
LNHAVYGVATNLCTQREAKCIRVRTPGQYDNHPRPEVPSLPVFATAIFPNPRRAGKASTATPPGLNRKAA